MKILQFFLREFVRAHEFFDLEPQRIPLGKSFQEGSGPSEIDTNRMEVGYPEKEVRGSSKSPGEVNLNTTSEGAFNSKATEGTCVGPSDSNKDYVTKGEFQTFAKEVFKRLDELKISKSPSSDVPPDVLQNHTTTITNLTSVVSSLQQQINSLPSKADVSSAINNVSFDTSFLDSLKSQLASVGEQYAIDLAEAGYVNFTSFQKEIRNLVAKALVIGTSPNKGNAQSLATRDAHNVQIRTINTIAEKTLNLQGTVTHIIAKALDNAIRTQMKPVRKFSKLLSAKLKHSRLLTSRLRKARLTCSFEALKPIHRSQDDQDPDHPEGENQERRVSEAKGVRIGEVSKEKATEPSDSNAVKDKGKVLDLFVGKS
ncbi:hypothetical protein OSB04_019921 [Centaurea solstitialis]|uniref:Uncharacterized protein n=1 Tax=Centaurea solstitialis TaxID=347529 RepID=A0AA38SRR2_9ASTR|nr:hypothetical protein OSB04_019921 [Centaurea solstitialis]